MCLCNLINIIIFNKVLMFFKIVYGNQIHVMNTKDIITYGNLEAFIKSVFKKLPAKYTLTYKDSDEDMICLLNDVDMKTLFESGMNKIRIEIQECHEDFYDHTQQIVIEDEPLKKKEEPIVAQKVEIAQSVPESPAEIKTTISEKSVDESINEKLSKIMPEIISKIKEEVMTESKIREAKPKMEETKPETQPQFNSQVVHAHVTCDECHAHPIVGIRYKCVVCPDFDVCQKCEAKSTHDHPFLKIKKIKHTPMKIFAVIDDENESLQFNGQRIPLPGLSEGLNLLSGLFGGQRRPEQCKQAFNRCKGHFQKFAKQFKEQMNQNMKKTEEKQEEKVEPKVQQPVPESKKVQQVVNQPIITEEKKEEPKVEEKKEQKEQKKVQPKPTISQEDLFIEAANYISQIMNQDFRKAYRFVVNYPGLSKEQILMKFLEQ